MKPLTALERRVLWMANTKAGVLIVGPKHADRICLTDSDGERVVSGRKPTTALANRLVLKGYAATMGSVLRITHEGQKALKVPLAPLAETYLHKRDGLTTRRDLAVRDEPALMEAPHPDWRNRAEAHRKLSRADLDAARLSGLDHPEERLRELRRMAAERGVSISSELRLVERGLRSLERKLRRDAA